MYSHQAAEQWLDIGANEPGLADHAFEGRHVRKATNRLDQIAIAFLVLGQKLAEFWHKLVRIGIIDFRKSRPKRCRKLQAEEAAAALQDALCLRESLVDVGHVPDTKGYGIGIEALVIEGQLLGILL